MEGASTTKDVGGLRRVFLVFLSFFVIVLFRVGRFGWDMDGVVVVAILVMLFFRTFSFGWDTVGLTVFIVVAIRRLGEGGGWRRLCRNC